MSGYTLLNNANKIPV